MPTTPQSEMYYNAKTASDACNIAQKALPQTSRNINTPIYIKRTENDETVVGVRGIIFAIILIWRHLNTSKLTIQSIAKDIDLMATSLWGSWISQVNDRTPMGYDISVSSIDRATQDNKLIASFVTSACNALKLRCENDDCMFDENWEKELITTLQHNSFKSVAEVYSKIAKILDDVPYREPTLTPEEIRINPKISFLNRNLRHVLPAHLAKYLPDPYNDSDEISLLNVKFKETSSITESLYRDLRSNDKDRRLILLHGNTHAGKSAVIINLLRKLAEVSQKTLCLSIETRAGVQGQLPVFLINTQRKTNQNVIREVLVFLTMLTNSACKTEQQAKHFIDGMVSSNPNPGSTAMMIKHVRELHKKFPAFFIFTGWEDLEFGSSRKILREVANGRLITALFESNHDSRILISTLKPAPHSQRIAEDMLPIHKQRKVRDPQFSELKRYFNHYEYPEEFSRQLRTLELDIDGKLVPGIALLTIAAAIGTCSKTKTRRTALLELIEEFVSEIARSKSGKKLSLTPFYEFIIDEFAASDCLEAILIIASSEDGMRASSIKQAILGLHDPYYRRRKENWVQISENLHNLSGLANGFFLRTNMNDRFDIDEFGIDESAMPDEDYFELDIAVAEQLLSTISLKKENSKWSDEARINYQRQVLTASRQVAILARFRAQTKRYNTDRSLRPLSVACFVRDMQCYEALLASIDPNDVPDPSNIEKLRAAQPLLRLKSDAVFTTTTKFEPVAALRFALKAILRTDIDGGDHQMTMSLDQDQLRLRLYLLMVFPIGRRHFWSLNDLSLSSKTGKTPLPKKLPRHLTTCFDLEEQILLLETIAVSAFHCQLPNIVKWARQRCDEIVEGVRESQTELHNDASHYIHASARIWCTATDISLMIGRPLDNHLRSEVDGSGHALTLHQLQIYLKTNYRILESLFDQLNGKLDFENMHHVLVWSAQDGNRVEAKSWMRLKAREAELLSRICYFDTDVSPDRDSNQMANMIYSILEEMEHAVCSSLGNENPIISSGRTARQHIKVLLRSPQFLGTRSKRSGNDWKGADSKIRSLIETNKSRLYRYGGAEQVGVFLDMARYEMGTSSKASVKSLNLARRAQILSRDGSTSRGTKMEVLKVVSTIQVSYINDLLSHAKSEDNAIQNLVTEVRENLNLLNSLARSTGYQPTLAICQFLRATIICNLMKAGRPPLMPTAALIRGAYQEASNALQIMRNNNDVLFRNELIELKEHLKTALID